MTTKYFAMSAVAAFIGLTAASSCTDALEIAQHGVVTKEDFYKTDADAQQAAASIYYQIRSMEYNTVMCKAALSDDFWAGGADRGDNGDLELFNEWRFDADGSYVEALWTGYYKVIYRSNLILENVAEDSAIKKRCVAEAHVFRAWAFFELVSMWGNIPLIDHCLVSDAEYNQPVSTPEQVWALVNADLEAAINSGALATKSSIDDKETWTVTKEYAQALYGKALLWQGKNAEAAAQLDAVINSGKYRLMQADELPYGDLLKIDGENCAESLFEIVRVWDANNPSDNFNFCPLMLGWRLDQMERPAEGDQLASLGWGFMGPRKNLYDAFVSVEGADGYRLNQSIKTYAQIQEMGYVIKNYVIAEGYFTWKKAAEAKQLHNNFYDSNNVRMMRFAEVLLLAAEANVTVNPAKTTEYMNMIRQRAQAPTKDSYTLDDVKLEKRLELCNEGCRFQDIIRWKDADVAAKMADFGSVYPRNYRDGHIEYVNLVGEHGFKTSKHYLLPIPGPEVRQNTALNGQNNPGW